MTIGIVSGYSKNNFNIKKRVMKEKMVFNYILQQGISPCSSSYSSKQHCCRDLHDIRITFLISNRYYQTLF